MFSIPASPAITATSSLPSSPLPFADRLSRALTDLRKGIPILLTDDPDREDEADLILPARTMGVAEMARFIRDGSGIVCLCLTEHILARLELPPMVKDNGSRFHTAFTVSIEARDGVSTGVSAADRVTTIHAAIHPRAKATDLVRPGHVFPLRARAGGVLVRRGHTEGSVDLARLAGCGPAGVLCELMNPDGSLARGQQVRDYAEAQGLVLLSIAELADWRLAHPDALPPLLDDGSDPLEMPGGDWDK